jgi:predicted RND superfamily exporter protein
MWSVVIMQAAFLLAYRNVLSFPIAFFPVALGLLIAFGIHSLVTSGFTPLTAAIGAMLVGCGIDYPVYFVSYFEAARTRGMTLPAARDDTVISLATPLLAGCATSIVGFLAIATSRIQALRDFAFLGGLGLALALAGTIWILPATLTLAARAGWLGRAGPRLRVGGLVRLACANPRTSIGICVATAAISAASLSFTHGVRFESDLNVMHPAPNAPLETQRIIANKFGSADSMIVYIEAGSDAELVSAAYRVQQALRSPNAAASGVAESFGLPALLPDPSRASARAAQMAAIDAGQVIADFDSALSDSIFDTAAFAQYREFLQRLLTDSTAPTIETLSGYADLYNMLVAPADNGRRSSVVLLTLARDETDARARDATVTEIRHALDPIPQATLTGLGVVGYDVEHSVRRDVPLVVTLASGAVILLLLVSLRSLRDTGLTLIPVAFGVLCLLGYMSIAGERFNLANTVAMPLLIGVGVDYGIFMVSMARQARLAGDGPEGAISRLAASLHAILLSATTNIVGFGSLAFTSTPAVQSLGRAISVGIVACVAGTLLMLTPILTLHDRSDGPAGRPE